MSKKGFRYTQGRVQKATQIINGTRTNATIRDLEEEEGELEEKEGTVVSIKEDNINGNGWTVKDKDGQTYLCSCANSMYELPETKQRGGLLYPTETVKVKFQINPVLRLNTITEITSLGKETDKLDINKWKHGDESTTVIAKPRSAISISNGFITMNYDNNNQVIANDQGISTEGDNTNINTKTLNINSNNINVAGKLLTSIIDEQALNISNEYASYNVNTINKANLYVDRSNNMTQVHIDTGDNKISGYGVIGEIKDQKAIPLREQTQQLVTDGHCVDIVVIDEDGIIRVKSFENDCTEERLISSTNNWITPQIESRNYIKVIVKQTCNSCDEGTNTKSEFINYCPSCQNFNTLIDTSTSVKCNTCGTTYYQNCGHNINNPSSEKLKKYQDNFISAYGTTCKYCNTQLQPNTNKQYVNYCPECQQWNWLRQSEMEQDGNTINILECGYCNSKFCSTCGIDQDKHGIVLRDDLVSYTAYKNAFRKLKYIKDGV